MKNIVPKILFILLAVLLLPQSYAIAQDSIPLHDTNRKIVLKRSHLKPVLSMPVDLIREVLDTIDTQSPGKKLILYADNTWKFYRDPADILQKQFFNTNWTNTRANPFNVELDDLPDRIALWLVDSLSEYKCPTIKKVYSPFGYRHRRRHQGVDLPLHTGDNVYAAFSGKVRISRYYKAYGNLVIIRHENGLETFYGHLSKLLVNEDEWVEAGTVIGLGGSTGRSTGPHLHFETRYLGYAFDPQWMIDFESGKLRHRLFVVHRKYLNANSRYVPESELEEEEIILGDKKDYAVADSIANVKRIEAEKAAEAAKRYYKVRPGDSLTKIARRNGTTVSAICKLNSGLTPKSVLRIGRSLRVK